MTVMTGVTSGLRDLDAKLGGLQKSDLIIPRQRPAIKALDGPFATNIGFNAAQAIKDRDTNEYNKVAFFSLEMSSEQLATRIMAGNPAFHPTGSGAAMSAMTISCRIVEASQAMSQAPFYIDDTPALNIPMLRTGPGG